MITRSKLKSILSNLEALYSLDSKLYDLSTRGVCLFNIEPLNCVTNDLIYLLQKALELEDDNSTWYNDLSYFICELNFGKDYKPSSVIDQGEDIDLSSIEKFCDYMEKQGKITEEEDTKATEDDLKDLFEIVKEQM